MLCNNCKSEIGDRIECNFCGYNPQKDSLQNAGSTQTEPKLPPVEIVLKKSTNGMAVAGFILSFFAFDPLLGTLTLIFSIIGLKNSKRKRSGRKRAIFGILAVCFWFTCWVSLISVFVIEAMNPGTFPFLAGMYV